jgi:Protein of unknown function (DUF3618)
MTAGETRDTASETGSGEAPPDDPQALVEDINRTREELGETVEALAAKGDVKARAQQRAAEVSGQLKGKLDGMKQDLASRADQLKSGLTGKAAGTRQAVTERAAGTSQAVAERGKTILGASQPAAKRLGNRAAQAGAAAWAAAPEPVQQGGKRVARTVDQHRIPAIAIAGVTLLAGWLAIRWLRR